LSAREGGDAWARDVDIRYFLGLLRGERFDRTWKQVPLEHFTVPELPLLVPLEAVRRVAHDVRDLAPEELKQRGSGIRTSDALVDQVAHYILVRKCIDEASEQIG